MQADERQVRLAAQLYEMRDTAQRLLGGRYTAKMAELGAALRQVAERTGRQPLAIAIETARDASPVDVCCLLAAAVELAEPSPAAAPAQPQQEPSHG